MRVLTFGWDYPPVKNGGLGVACQGLTEELYGLGVEVIFVLPRAQEMLFSGKRIFADLERVRVRPIYTPLQPYGKSNTILEILTARGHKQRYLIEEVYEYARKAAVIAAEEEYDVIHAHDWVSYLAGLAAKEISGKPLILHVHATSYDQAGGDSVDPAIYEIERRAFEEADKIITVSRYTKSIIERKHGVNGDKVVVVHNGSGTPLYTEFDPLFKELKAEGKKIVLYHGRITLHKGPDYFIRAARRVVDVDPNVIFVISGWGDMEQQIINMVGEYGLTGNVLFVGALWGEERDRMYQSADLLVMPSVSEPFGLVALEAIQHGTPALISKQSGVGEVLKHVLRADFWDVEEMANKILAAVQYGVMNDQLVKYGRDEVLLLSWKRAAAKVRDLYQSLIDLFKNKNS